MARCSVCNGSTVWEEDVGSAICVSCGTLVDPSQSVLTSHLDQPDSARQYDHLWDPSSSSTLKSFRTSTGWDLAGQGKEARDKRNTYAIHALIKSLTYSLSAPGLSPRATTLFTQAMAAGNYRWGRKAKLVAGACISIALREAKNPDSLRDIAFLLDENLITLSRTFASVIRHLNLALVSADPSMYLSTLQSHLTSILDTSEPSLVLPPTLVLLLRPLSFPTVIQTCNHLATLVSRLGTSTPLSHLPMAPTACGILILSLEAEARTSFTHLGELARCLAARIGVGKGVVMSRYKMIQDIIEEWVKEVPWLDKYKSTKGRAKVAKRTVVAKGLKDVVLFQEDIWRKKMESQRPDVSLELDPDDQDKDPSGSESDTPISTSPSISLSDCPPEANENQDRPKKRRKTRHALDQASIFLLNPLSDLLPSPAVTVPTSICDVSPTSTPSSAAVIEGRSPTPTISFPLTTYLLSASPSTLSLCAQPTRLQCLAAERGGAGLEEVADDELFGDGELEGLLRDNEEVQKLRDLWGWDSDSGLKGPDDPSQENSGAQNIHAVTKKRNRAPKDKQTQAHSTTKGSKRVNMEALAQLLQGDADTLGDTEAFSGEKAGELYLLDPDDPKNGYYSDGDSPNDLDPELRHWKSSMASSHVENASEIVLDDWRPPSPNAGLLHDASDRYDMEYE